MPTSVEMFDCVDYAVLWEADGVDNFNVVKINEPVEIRCRWNLTLTEGQDSQGSKIAYGIRLCALRHISIDSILWHGKLVDLPLNPTELVQVKQDFSNKDVHGLADRYEYGLARFMDNLPIFAPGTGS